MQLIDSFEIEARAALKYRASPGLDYPEPKVYYNHLKFNTIK